MTILLYTTSIILILAGFSIVTKALNPTTAKMGRLEHVLICFFFIIGGVSAIITEMWVAIFITIGFVWVVYGFNEYRRRHKKPSLSFEDYGNNEIVDKFLDWWLSNDPQVSEIRRPSTQVIWHEGYRPLDINSQKYKSAEEYFRGAFKESLLRLQNATEHEWIKELEQSGQKIVSFMHEIVEIKQAYNITMGKFDVRYVDQLISEEEDNQNFKKAFLRERLLSNQRRLLMWQFHEHFGRWYTPQG